MCGIVGLFGKNEETRSSLGDYIVPMIVCMGDRGPDSAGLAVFSESGNGNGRRFNLYSFDREFPWDSVMDRPGGEFQQAGLAHCTPASDLCRFVALSKSGSAFRWECGRINGTHL